MNLTMRLKLLPMPEQADAMLRTMERFNAACDALAGVAFARRCANKVEPRSSPTTISAATSVSALR